MSEGAGLRHSDFFASLGGRPGWRLEPRSTPGAPPVWCFVFDGKIEFSVTVEGGAIDLYLMETDREIVLKDSEELVTWLRTHRVEALREPVAKVPQKSRLRDIFKWS